MPNEEHSAGRILSGLAIGAAAVGLPGLPTAIVAGLAQHLISRRQENLVGTLQLVEDACEDLSPDDVQASWRRPTFGDLMEAVLPAAWKASSEARRRQLANVLAAGLRSDDITVKRLALVAQLLDEVDEYGVLWLQFFAADMAVGEAAEWFEQHPYMREHPPTMGDSDMSKARYHLSRASFERLISLRLLKPAVERFPLTLRHEKDTSRGLRQVIDYLSRDQRKREQWRVSGIGRMLLLVIEGGLTAFIEAAAQTAEGED